MSTTLLSRRTVVSAAIALAAWPDVARARSSDPEIAELERANGGRLGVHAIDAAGRVLASYRPDERFLFCSTFKLFLAAAVLERVQGGKERLDRPVAVAESDLVFHAPAVREHLAAGSMSIEALCRAIVVVSDNSAANLLLDTIGNPPGLTAYFRRMGDAVSRLDRREPELNRPNGELDTTSPRAAAQMFRRIVTGGCLDAASLQRLEGWMIDCSTGLKRLRAGVPDGWVVGDKTGTGAAGETNDIAFLRAPGRPRAFIASYYVGPAIAQPQREAVLAEVGRIISRRAEAGAKRPA